MSRLNPSVVILALMFVVACQPSRTEMAPEAGSAEDEATIAAAFRSMLAAYNAMDAASMATMVADDYEGIIPQGNHVRGRAGFEAQLKSDFAQPRPEGFLVTAEIGYTQWHGADHATVGGTYQVAGVPAGSPNSGSFMFNYERTGAGWMQTNGLVAAFVPPPATTAKK